MHDSESLLLLWMLFHSFIISNTWAECLQSHTTVFPCKDILVISYFMFSNIRSLMGKQRQRGEWGRENRTLMSHVHSTNIQWTPDTKDRQGGSIEVNKKTKILNFIEYIFKGRGQKNKKMNIRWMAVKLD